MRPSFDRAFRRLTGAFRRYQGAPRDPDRLDELVGARSELEDARRGMRAGGVRYVASPENSGFVEPGLGTDSRSVAGKVAAVVFVLVTMVVIVVVARAVDRAVDDPPLTFDEAFDDGFDLDDRGRCLWTLTGRLRSGADAPIVVSTAWMETTSGVASWIDDDVTVPAKAVAPVTMTFRLPGSECPVSIGAVWSGDIRFNDEFTTRVESLDRSP